eukprot:TRINITY_DN23452_c0_g1_i1.p1 TRINITY_DN23452_c0_g1~~TRINITY_DN23452_c0_g1_i1.p1  ORF type:complete len:430 (-),score=27.24 TRINITY_DN23452_c0_g1_i1:364-1587(-)
MKSCVGMYSNRFVQSSLGVARVIDCLVGDLERLLETMAMRVTYVFALTSSSMLAAGNKCACLYQGKLLPEDIYKNYPNNNPGQYKDLAGVSMYGTTCGAWDQMPGMPWSSSCPKTANFSTKQYNWCQNPWCYVDKDCPGAAESSVFNGSTVAYYAYSACGDIPDCLTGPYAGGSWTGDWPTGCPYDRNNEKDYRIDTKGDCSCLFQGEQLPASIYTNYPDKTPAGCTEGGTGDAACTKYPGMYKDLVGTPYYGTACAAWDQQPQSPWFSYCPDDADWCQYDYNWCTAPWCFVSENCSTAVPTMTFKGANKVAYYSYGACLDTPNCLTNVAWTDPPNLTGDATGCPFDITDNKWDVRHQTCPNGWSPKVEAEATTAATTTEAAANAAGHTDAQMLSVSMLVGLLLTIK